MLWQWQVNCSTVCLQVLSSQCRKAKKNQYQSDLLHGIALNTLVCLFHSLIAHRGGSQVAASFETTGNGFVQDKNGNVLLRVLEGGKKGQVFSAYGSKQWSWNHYEGTTIPADSNKIEMPLGKEMAIRYDIVTGIVEVYFMCDGIQQMLCKGSNKAEVMYSLSIGCSPRGFH